MDLSWMAWTMPTALFFVAIATMLVAMSVWEYFDPGGGPRVGILQFETTRGDRLFVALLVAAFVHLAWLGLVGGGSLWWATALSVAFAVVVFALV